MHEPMISCNPGKCQEQMSRTNVKNSKKVNNKNFARFHINLRLAHWCWFFLHDPFHLDHFRVPAYYFLSEIQVISNYISYLKLLIYVYEVIYLHNKRSPFPAFHRHFIVTHAHHVRKSL